MSFKKWGLSYSVSGSWWQGCCKYIRAFESTSPTLSRITLDPYSTMSTKKKMFLSAFVLLSSNEFRSSEVKYASKRQEEERDSSCSTVVVSSFKTAKLSVEVDSTKMHWSLKFSLTE